MGNPIPKVWVWEAYQSVKANGGAAGIDRETLETFDRRLGDNLTSSGAGYAPAAISRRRVKAVPIPKKSGGARVLGVPTVADRIAQTVVKRIPELVQT